MQCYPEICKGCSENSCSSCEPLFRSTGDTITAYLCNCKSPHCRSISVRKELFGLGNEKEENVINYPTHTNYPTHCDYCQSSKHKWCFGYFNIGNGLAGVCNCNEQWTNKKGKVKYCPAYRFRELFFVLSDQSYRFYPPTEAK